MLVVLSLELEDLLIIVVLVELKLSLLDVL
jgi:hypothetical protein